MSEADTYTKDLPQLLKTFARDPVSSVKTPLRLSWPAALLLQTAGAAISGICAALVARSTLDFIISVAVFPIVAVMMCSVLTLFLYYLFAGFSSIFLDIRRLNSLVVIAILPFFVLHAFSGFLAPLDLIGFALSAILLTVGLVEQFGLEKKFVLKLLASIFGVFFVVWSIVQILRA